MSEVGIGDEHGNIYAGVRRFGAELFEVRRLAARDMGDAQVGAVETKPPSEAKPVPEREPARLEIRIQRNRQAGKPQRALAWWDMSRDIDDCTRFPVWIEVSIPQRAECLLFRPSLQPDDILPAVASAAGATLGALRRRTICDQRAGRPSRQRWD